jgi:carbon storage regulator
MVAGGWARFVPETFDSDLSECQFVGRDVAMLVLSRKRDERIMIGDQISLLVVDIMGDKVRLGIEAPSDVTVHRKEVYEAIQRERALENEVVGVG